MVVDTASSHPSSLEVWKYSVTRPPPLPPPPPPPPPRSFQNYLSICDKQLHQKMGLSSVNTELADMIHQWDSAVNNTYSEMLSLLVQKKWIHEIMGSWEEPPSAKVCKYKWGSGLTTSKRMTAPQEVSVDVLAMTYIRTEDRSDVRNICKAKLTGYQL